MALKDPADEYLGRIHWAAMEAIERGDSPSDAIRLALLDARDFMRYLVLGQLSRIELTRGAGLTDSEVSYMAYTSGATRQKPPRPVLPEPVYDENWWRRPTDKERNGHTPPAPDS